MGSIGGHFPRWFWILVLLYVWNLLSNFLIGLLSGDIGAFVDAAIVDETVLEAPSVVLAGIFDVAVGYFYPSTATSNQPSLPKNLMANVE